MPAAPPQVPLILGLDPSLMRLGFAFVEMLTGKPRWCGTLKIYEQDQGWREQQMYKQLCAIKHTLDAKTDAHYYVPLIAIEDMYIGINRDTGKKLAESAGICSGQCHVIWPDAEIDRFIPPAWRLANGLEKGTKKPALYAHAVELGFEPPPLLKDPKKDTGQDAADAGLIARAAWHEARKRGSRPAGRAMVTVEGA